MSNRGVVLTNLKVDWTLGRMLIAEPDLMATLLVLDELFVDDPDET